MQKRPQLVYSACKLRTMKILPNDDLASILVPAPVTYGTKQLSGCFKPLQTLGLFSFSVCKLNIYVGPCLPNANLASKLGDRKSTV